MGILPGAEPPLPHLRHGFSTRLPRPRAEMAGSPAMTPDEKERHEEDLFRNVAPAARVCCARAPPARTFEPHWTKKDKDGNPPRRHPQARPAPSGKIIGYGTDGGMVVKRTSTTSLSKDEKSP